MTTAPKEMNNDSFRQIVTEIDTTTGIPKPSEAQEEIQIEIIDDTPSADRGKARPEAAADAPQGLIPSDDELKTYSESVQKRFKRMTYEFHEQRRARESAERQTEEAARIARQLYDDNRRMRTSMKSGEQVLVEQARGRVDAQLEAARGNLRKAHESGDTEALITAQEEMSAIQAERSRVHSYQPQYQNDEMPQIQQQAPQQQRPQTDAKAEDWAKKNDWFQKDKRMTGFAFGVHEELVTEQGIDPRSNPEAYYSALDKQMRTAFPDHPWPDRQQAEAPQRRQMSSVVAPAHRTNSGVSKDGRRVQLTASQVALAKRLGVTAQEYAAELVKQAQQS